MFIIELNYRAPLEEIDALLNEHGAFLEKYYASGNFIASGRKVPREGGIILAQAENKETIEKIISEDPIFRHKLATYNITEFLASKKSEQAFLHTA